MDFALNEDFFVVAGCTDSSVWVSAYITSPSEAQSVEPACKIIIFPRD